MLPTVGGRSRPGAEAAAQPAYDAPHQQQQSSYQGGPSHYPQQQLLHGAAMGLHAQGHTQGHAQGHAPGHDDDGGGSCLPAIGGGFSSGISHTGAGVHALKIDSKSLMAGGARKALPNSYKYMGKPPPKKAVGRTFGGGPPSMSHSYQMAAPELGVGNSSQHASHSQISEPEALGAVGVKSLHGIKTGKSYCSPYSQRFQGKSKY